MLFGFRPPLSKISLWLFTTRVSGFSHFPTCISTYSYFKDYYEKREKFVPKIKVKIIIDLDGARSGPNGLVKCLEALEDEDEMDANMVNVTEKSKA